MLLQIFKLLMNKICKVFINTLKTRQNIVSLFVFSKVHLYIYIYYNIITLRIALQSRRISCSIINDE